METNDDSRQPGPPKTAEEKNEVAQTSPDHKSIPAEKATNPDGKIPLVKDIDEGSPDRK